MSEYQYYEFTAVDRPLTGREQAELRSLSTRADITATSFVNTYEWGDFKGDPREADGAVLRRAPVPGELGHPPAHAAATEARARPRHRRPLLPG